MDNLLEDVNNLVAKGAFEEALQRHIWFHNHILEEDSSQSGVRVSFALSAWRKLADEYPPAMDALLEIRNANERQCRESRFTDEDLFGDIISINTYIDANHRSFEIFDELEKVNPDLAKEYWPMLKNVALDLLKRFGFDFEAEMDFMERVYISKRALFDDPEIGEMVRESGEKHLASKACQLIATALKLGDIDSAKVLKDKALDLITLDDVGIKLKKLHILEEER